MADYKLTPKEIYETVFGTKMRGYDKDQVDEMLDSIIVDYETYQAEVLRLEEENEFLKNKISDLESNASSMRPSVPQVTADLDQTQRFDPFSHTAPVPPTPVVGSPVSRTSVQLKEPSNFDLLKRINRLERAVFGPESKFSGDTSELR